MMSMFKAFALLLLEIMTDRLDASDAAKAPLRYNEVQQISSHNSYAKNGPKGNIEQQFEAGVRSFELDIHAEGEAGNWLVYHFVAGGDFVQNLRQGLIKFKRIHDKFPQHEVVTVWLELKNNWHSGGHSPSDLDSLISETLPNLAFAPS